MGHWPWVLSYRHENGGSPGELTLWQQQQPHATPAASNQIHGHHAAAVLAPTRVGRPCGKSIWGLELPDSQQPLPST